MNDTVYLATVLDAHRAEDLRREVALREQQHERDIAGAQTPAHRATSVVTR